MKSIILEPTVCILEGLTSSFAKREAAAKTACEAAGAKLTDMFFTIGSSDVVGIMELDSVEQAIGLKEAFMASGVWKHIQLLYEFDVDAAIAAANKVREIISQRAKNPDPRLWKVMHK